MHCEKGVPFWPATCLLLSVLHSLPNALALAGEVACDPACEPCLPLFGCAAIASAGANPSANVAITKPSLYWILIQPPFEAFTLGRLEGKRLLCGRFGWRGAGLRGLPGRYDRRLRGVARRRHPRGLVGFGVRALNVARIARRLAGGPRLRGRSVYGLRLLAGRAGWCRFADMAGRCGALPVR